MKVAISIMIFLAAIVASVVTGFLWGKFVPAPFCYMGAILTGFPIGVLGAHYIREALTK